MINLLLAILFSSLFPISWKIADKLKINAKSTIFINYIFGGLFILITFFLTYSSTIEPNNLLIPIILGIPTGVIYFLSLVLYQKTIINNGLSIAALFMKIGMIIPIILSILIFSERPSTLQYIGILLALFAIIIINGGIKQFKGVTPILLLLFLLSGLGEFSNKVFEGFADINYKNIFIFTIFLTAALLGFIKDHKVIIDTINLKNSFVGLIIGIINSLTTYFTVKTFSEFDVSISIVIINISIILVVSLIGFSFFKERIKRNELIGLILSIITILLIAI